MELIIKNDCVECPFMTDTHSCCSLKAKIANRHMCDEDVIPYIMDKGHMIPEWCPLKTESVTIKIQ